MMKALTIWQPWASLIIAGVKPYEFRGWKAPGKIIGQRIGVHAGARAVKKPEIYDLISRLESDEAWSTGLKQDALPLLKRWLDAPHLLPLASIVGTATLGTPVSANTILHEFGGVVNDSDRNEHANYAWPMIDVKPCEPIVPFKGAQGFWDFAEGLL